MIEDDLSRVGFERCEDKGEKSAPKFIPRSSYHQEKKTIKSNKAHYPSNPKPSFNPKREVRNETPSRERKPLFTCFMSMRVTWMSFASVVRGLRRGILSMLETHIVMSSLSFCLVLTLVLHLTLLLVLFLSSLIDLTIAHMVLVHERTALCLDALVTTHVLIVVVVSHVGLVFLLEGPTLTLSRDTCTVHVFPIMVHVPLGQVVRCKGL
jgi:hypothetical protein